MRVKGKLLGDEIAWRNENRFRKRFGLSRSKVLPVGQGRFAAAKQGLVRFLAKSVMRSMNKHFNQMKNPRLQPPHQLLPSASSFAFHLHVIEIAFSF